MYWNISQRPFYGNPHREMLGLLLARPLGFAPRLVDGETLYEV
jgi:hypothetical protein